MGAGQYGLPWCCGSLGLLFPSLAIILFSSPEVARLWYAHLAYMSGASSWIAENWRLSFVVPCYYHYFSVIVLISLELRLVIWN